MKHQEAQAHAKSEARKFVDQLTDLSELERNTAVDLAAELYSTANRGMSKETANRDGTKAALAAATRYAIAYWEAMESKGGPETNER